MKSGTQRRGRVAFGVLALFLVSGPAQAAWYNSNWSYRKPVTLHAAKVTANQTDFPVLISVPTDNDLRDFARNDGNDILFTLSDGTTKLSHEIEKFDGTNGQLVAWIEVPNLSSSVDTALYMYYGYGTASPQEDVPNVWDGNFKGVWHLHDDFLDSTANPNNGTNGGSTDNIAKIADGQSFDGIDDYVDVGSHTSIDNVFAGGGTLSAWIFPTGWGENNFGRILDKASTTSGLNGWGFELDGETSEDPQTRTIRLEHGGAFSSRGVWTAPTDAIVLNDWNYVVVVYNKDSTANDPTIYVNSIPQAMTQLSSPLSSLASDAARPVRIGNFSGGTNRTFDGLIDEARISDTVRPLSWIQTEHNNQSDPATFHALGAQESAVTADLVKRAYQLDGTPIADAAMLPTGTPVRYLLYVNNTASSPINDVSVQDVLDAAYDYTPGSIRIDNSVGECAAAACTAVEEAAIFTAAVAQAASCGAVPAACTDAVDADPVSWNGTTTIDSGNQNRANAQLDLAADTVWAMVFTVTMQ